MIAKFQRSASPFLGLTNVSSYFGIEARDTVHQHYNIWVFVGCIDGTQGTQSILHLTFDSITNLYEFRVNIGKIK